MNRNKLFMVVLVVVMRFTGISNAETIADSLQFPLDSYSLSQDFGEYGKVQVGKYHLGEDAIAKSLNNVYAIGNGIVKHAQYHAPYTDSKGVYHRNYGGMYMIEHILPDGEKITALYAHMYIGSFQKTVGQIVTKGEYLGQIGTRAQNGDWSEHLHFGIRKGGYPSDPSAYVCGDWIFGGYTACANVVDDWYDPTDFIIAHKIPDSTIYYTFSQSNPQGWTTGWDTQASPEPQWNEWRVKVINNPPKTNPGILSPMLPAGIMAKDTVIKIRAKVVGQDQDIKPLLWIKHKDGNWDNKVSIGKIAKNDQSYREYIINLSTSTGQIKTDVLEVSQFSLEMSDGGNGDDEYWYLDSVEIYPNNTFKSDTLALGGPDALYYGYSTSTPTALRITGPVIVNENNSLNFYAVFDYSDGSSVDATNNVGWGADCPVGSITYKGLFTAIPVISDTACKIKAIYTNLSASWNINIVNTSNVSDVGGLTDTTNLQDIKITNVPHAISEYTTTKVGVGGYYGGNGLVDITSLATVSVSGCASGYIDSSKELVVGKVNGIYEECLITVNYGNKVDTLSVKVQTTNCQIAVPSQYPSIQRAINIAFDSCVIMVAPGTYKENLLIQEKKITIISSAGAEQTIIDGSGKTNGEKYGSAIVIIDTNRNKSGSTIIDGFTITKGQGYWGNSLLGIGIYIYNSSPIIKNSIITGNNNTTIYDVHGGGVGIFEKSQPVFENDIITNNNLTRTGSKGGGIYSELSAPVINNSSITNNFVAGDGGGLYLNDNIYVSQTNSTINPSISNSEIANNKANYKGGGIFCFGCNSTFTNISVFNNSASTPDGRGGGVYLQNSNSTFDGGSITQNVSDGYAGGISISGNRTINFNNFSIKDNLATKIGNNLYASGSAVNTTNTSLGDSNDYYICSTCVLSMK